MQICRQQICRGLSHLSDGNSMVVANKYLIIPQHSNRLHTSILSPDATATMQHSAAKQRHQHHHCAFICVACTSLHKAAACLGHEALLAHVTVHSISHNTAPLLSGLPGFRSQQGKGEAIASLQDVLMLLQRIAITA